MEVKIMNMILRNHFFDSFFNNFGTYERSTSHYEVVENEGYFDICLLYTSDAADDMQV